MVLSKLQQKQEVEFFTDFHFDFIIAIWVKNEISFYKISMVFHRAKKEGRIKVKINLNNN